MSAVAVSSDASRRKAMYFCAMSEMDDYLRMMRELIHKSGNHAKLARNLVALGREGASDGLVRKWSNGTVAGPEYAPLLDELATQLKLSPQFVEITASLRRKNSRRGARGGEESDLPRLLTAAPVAEHSGADQWRGVIELRGQMWQLVPSPKGVSATRLDPSAISPAMVARSINATMSISPDGTSVARMSEGVLDVAWINRMNAKLAPWPKAIDTRLDIDARLLSISASGTEGVQCVVSTPSETCLVRVTQHEVTMVTKVCDAASRNAVLISGEPHTVDLEGEFRTKWLRESFPEITESISLGLLPLGKDKCCCCHRT